MLNDFQRVQVLSEALPFIQKFAGKTIVIKYGGSAMQDQLLKNKVIEDILFLSYVGLKLVLVHGGGPVINHWLNKLNIESNFHKGVRVTDSATMEVVEMVLVGKVNQELVALINKKKGKAIGLSGKDARLIIASQLVDELDNFVGKIDKVNSDIINLLIQEGYIPVIASVAASLEGQSYNINADTVAGSIASKLKAEKLILLTDTSGIMQNIHDPQTLIRLADVSKIEDLKKKNVISGGMIPKVDCCTQAISNGVKSAHIIDGRVEHALLLEILTKNGIGSMLV
uniref:Acetylglutamate kinase n=1 Tax=Corallina officinalis TaxID=35170 RepID=A0A6M3WB38_COROI|nr:acetylglutamate kinase [Corallina officinalis]QJF58480.1 acetylglutamate kinase [Corallina officinalis]QJF58679.1 acetylglutamate kinase [Corallina officinalis]QJF58878.1 acetylglutamate kinase [Corallina officinalis]